MKTANHQYAPAAGLRYLFIDFNAYFASVEQHDDPALRGRPVIVIPTRSDHTSAIAASYEARPFGINRGTNVREARALCPGIAIRLARQQGFDLNYLGAKIAFSRVPEEVEFLF